MHSKWKSFAMTFYTKSIDKNTPLCSEIKLGIDLENEFLTFCATISIFLKLFVINREFNAIILSTKRHARLYLIFDDCYE